MKKNPYFWWRTRKFSKPGQVKARMTIREEVAKLYALKCTAHNALVFDRNTGAWVSVKLSPRIGGNENARKQQTRKTSKSRKHRKHGNAANNASAGH